MSPDLQYRSRPGTTGRRADIIEEEAQPGRTQCQAKAATHVTAPKPQISQSHLACSSLPSYYQALNYTLVEPHYCSSLERFSCVHTFPSDRD